ncbi:MAG TPA: hypothetical protein VJ716_02810 [Gaiellaceae bacterium]|nr:hypothetical protein [Gaiellaceae bacterium]
MGWRDRDYAKWTAHERRRFYGDGSTPSTRGSSLGTRVRPVPSALTAVLVSLVVALALGQLPREHPLIPALHFNLQSSAPNSVPAGVGRITIARRLPVGSFLTLHGGVPSGESGTVTVEGAYTRPPWNLLAAVPVKDGTYEARIQLNHKGLLHLRVTYPDGHRSVGETRVR